MRNFGYLKLFVISLIGYSSGQFQDLVGWVSRDPLVPNIVDIQCSNGPPGNYCQPNLSGYLRCNPDGSQQEVNCLLFTRCSCFVGERCADDIIDPCQVFNLPPHLPKDTSTVSYGQLIVRTPFPIPVYNFTRQQYQKSKDGNDKRRGDRQDTTWETSNGEKKTVSFQSAYISNGDGSFTKYVADITPPSLGKCQPIVNDVTDMPVTQIPEGAQDDGTEIIEGEVANRWLLKSGGQNQGSAQSIEYFYVVNDVVRDILRPKRYFARFDFGPTAKTTLIVNETFGLFYDQLVPSIGFYANPPRPCV